MTDGVARGPLIAPLLARAIVAVVAGGFCTIALLFVVEARTDSGQIALSVAFLIVLLVLQLFYFSSPGVNLRSPLAYVLLAVQACLSFLPLLPFGTAWIVLPSLVAGTVLRVLPLRLAWPVFAGIVLSMALVQNQLTHSVLDVAAASIGTVVAALAVYGLTRLAGLITELHAARTELAGVAVAHERLRFARDLHDLLGLSLSAIVPKGELAHRLVPSNPERARQELSEIMDISRRALADARAVAHGYRLLNLDEESRTAESVLAASRVEVRMERNVGELPMHIRTLLAAVLREGVGNVLEHSDAERCDIVMRQVGDSVSLDIVNDGVTGPVRQSPRGGLDTLSGRVAGLGGRLTAGLERDGRHRLRLIVPLAGEEVVEEAEAEPVPMGRGAGALVAVVLCGIFVQTALLRAYLHETVFRYTVSVGFMLMLLVIQLCYFSRPGTRLNSASSYAVLVVQACLVYLPMLEFGVPALAPGFLASSVLLVLRPVTGWPVFGVIVLTGGWVQANHSGVLLEVVNSTGTVLISGLVVYGLTWMARSVAELRTARIQLAHAAVAQERVRLARDLHDLLGLSLSAITLKSELAQRLVEVDPDQAREELTGILDISRLALTDVRLVASGSRALSLREECRTAESLLAAASVDVRVDVTLCELPWQVATLLAIVLREGVTNVLRHSKGERCEISVRRQDHVVCLDIVNDGVRPDPAARANGTGITNLSYRVAQLGGSVVAGLEPDGRFRLRARVPA